MVMKKIRTFLTKVSVFDFIFFALVVVLSLSLFLFFKRSVDTVTIRVKVTDHDVLYAKNDPYNWYATRIEVGDTEKDSLGRVISEIVNVESFNTSAVHKVVYVDIKTRAVYDKRRNIYSARGKNLAFGTPMRFGFSRVVVDGIVTEFPGSQNQGNLKVGKAVVSFLQREVEGSTANFVKKGDKIYDSNGSLLLELKNVVVKNSESLRLITTEKSGLFLRKDPVFKDVEGEVEVVTKTYNGEVYIFDDIPLKVGELLPLNMEKVSLFPFITNFELK